MYKISKFGKLGLSLFISLLLIITPIGAFAYTDSISDVKVIVTFNGKIDPEVIKTMREYKSKIKRQGKIVKSVSATIPSNLIPYIQSYSSVKSVEYDRKVTIQAQTRDWGITKTNAPSAWDMNFTGKGIKIAVIDSGISTHSDLVISGGVSFLDYTTSYQDDEGHGTHVAGIIGAKNNTFGTVGIAPDSLIYAVKSLDNEGSGYMSDIVAGIDWSIANDMDIINMSLGTQEDSPALRDAVTRATNSGIIVVAAAGNDGDLSAGDSVDYPGKYENVITVGATDSNNNIAYFSSKGPSVDVSAPGYNIYSTLNNGSYGYMSGTSMASPYVAGMVALYKEAYPTYTPSQIEQALKDNSLDLGEVGRDDVFGVGLIQAPTELPDMTVQTVYASSNGAKAYISSNKMNGYYKTYKVGVKLKMIYYNPDWYYSNVLNKDGEVVKAYFYADEVQFTKPNIIQEVYASPGGASAYISADKTGGYYKSYRVGTKLKMIYHSPNWFYSNVLNKEGKVVRAYFHSDEVQISNPITVQTVYANYGGAKAYVSTDKKSGYYKSYRAGTKLKMIYYNSFWYYSYVLNKEGKPVIAFFHVDEIK